MCKGEGGGYKMGKSWSKTFCTRPQYKVKSLPDINDSSLNINYPLVNLLARPHDAMKWGILLRF